MATTRARRTTKTTSIPTTESAPALPIAETDGPLLISVAEAARRIGIGRTVLYPHLMSGRLPSIVVGRSERKVIAAGIPTFVQSLWNEQAAMLGLAG